MNNQVTAYKIDFKYSNDFRFVDTLIYIFARTQENEILSKRECEVLREYIIRGYSDNTKDHIAKTLKIKRTTLNQFNHNLQNKRMLLPHPNNQNNKLLNPELSKLKEFYETNAEKKVFLVNFVDENR